MSHSYSEDIILELQKISKQLEELKEYIKSSNPKKENLDHLQKIAEGELANSLYEGMKVAVSCDDFVETLVDKIEKKLL